VRDELAATRMNLMDIKFDFVCSGFHSGAITELHTCLQRPVVLTCSVEDQSIRLWNYLQSTCELAHYFTKKQGPDVIKPLRCSAMHPSGYYLAVGLTDRLQLFHVLHKELRHFHTYEHKNIQVLRFSAGGQTLWAVDAKNIVVYNTFTLEKLKVMQCLSMHVSDIAFDHYDSQIAFISHDGFFQRYSQINFTKEGD
jgi:cilia- and flagella-associated protein 57